MTPCTMEFERLNLYVDGEVAPADELEVRRHLDVCAACRGTVESLVALKGAVAASAEVRPVPHTLRERLGTFGRPRHRRWWPWLGAVAAAAAVVAAVWTAAPRRGDDRVTEALVADHLHYLQEPQAIEIASNDPAYIAAWFGDKVGFPVRVPELPSADLLGARLCSLWGQKVALTFYEAGGRRLSLFVADATTFPEGLPSGECATGLGGYQVCVVPAAPTVLAMVADREQVGAVLSDLRGWAARAPAMGGGGP